MVANLTVSPPSVLSVTASPTTIVNGQSGTGTVNLTGAAPAGGLTVDLSDTSTLLSVPDRVTVPAGAAMATFTMTAGIATRTTPVTVSASLGSTTRSVIINVAPLQVASVAFSPDSPSGGTVVTLKVTLNGAAESSGRGHRAYRR